jgi:hypothetical protein
MRRIPLEIKIAFLEVVTVLIVLAAGYFSYRSLTYMADTLHRWLRPDANLLHLKGNSFKFSRGREQALGYLP